MKKNIKRTRREAMQAEYGRYLERNNIEWKDYNFYFCPKCGAPLSFCFSHADNISAAIFDENDYFWTNAVEINRIHTIKTLKLMCNCCLGINCEYIVYSVKLVENPNSVYVKLKTLFGTRTIIITSDMISG